MLTEKDESFNRSLSHTQFDAEADKIKFKV